jgi:hypothetical protein
MPRHAAYGFAVPVWPVSKVQTLLRVWSRQFHAASTVRV